MSQQSWLAGGSGLPSVIARTDAAMPIDGLPIACERAGGEGRRSGLKKRAAEITRSAAEVFALVTIQTISSRYDTEFLSTVANVDLIFPRRFKHTKIALIFLRLLCDSLLIIQPKFPFEY
jgi:hypothetical protein